MSITDVIEELKLEVLRLREVNIANTGNDYLDMKESAKFIKKSLSTMQKISANRIVPIYKPSNGKVYFLKEDLKKYMESGRRKSLDEIKKEAIC